MTLQAGRSVVVKFPEDSTPDLWQERVLLAKRSAGVWVAVTPDEEIETVDLNSHTYRILGTKRELPPGVAERDCYLVFREGVRGNFYTRDELTALKQEAAAMVASQAPSSQADAAPPATGRAAGSAAALLPATTARRREATPETAGALVRAGSARPRARSPAARSLTPDGAARVRLTKKTPAVLAGLAGVYPGNDDEDEDDGSIWITTEPLPGYPVGSTAPPPLGDLRRGHSGLSLISAGRYACVKQILPGEKEGYLQRLRAVAGSAAEEEASNDARVLTVKTTSLGRHREFSSLAEECSEELFEDFPLAGPRTASWCLQFLRKRRCPTDHHATFRAVTKLGPEAWGMGEHENLCQMIELAGSYDQLDLTNLAFAEAIFRRIQTIEWVHHERVRDLEATAGDRITVEELTAFSGASRTADVLMVAPALLSHVRSVVETDVTIMKSVRKAREERELRRKNKNKNPKKETGE